MRFFDEMLDKWGFGDGDALPNGIESYREVYVRGINHFAEVFGSSYRVVPYDRGGVHNPCRVYFRRVEDMDKPLHEVEVAMMVSGTDDAFQQAIDRAAELDLDDYLIVEVRIDADALEDALVNNSDV